MITVDLKDLAIVTPDLSHQIIQNIQSGNMEKNWLSNLALKAMRICRLNREAAGNHRQDMSGPVLETLMQNGYNQVTWNSNGSHHGQCRDLNRQTWGLQDFLATTEYDAPLFSRSHPGDVSCTLTVSGPGLPPIEVDSYGETDEAIGTNRPAPTPKAPKPTQPAPVQRPMPAVTEPKVVQTPEKKPKVVQVPKEIHKQIKNPFEKQDLSPEEYEQWLKDLEHENVEESIPAVIPPNPKYTDEEIEEWNRDMNRETSQKVPNWITGLFKG